MVLTHIPHARTLAFAARLLLEVIPCSCIHDLNGATCFVAIVRRAFKQWSISALVTNRQAKLEPSFLYFVSAMTDHVGLYISSLNQQPLLL
jgi:hypothetical protein